MREKREKREERKKVEKRRGEDDGEGRRIRWRGKETKTWKGDEGKV